MMKTTAIPKMPTSTSATAQSNTLRGLYSKNLAGEIAGCGSRPQEPDQALPCSLAASLHRLKGFPPPVTSDGKLCSPYTNGMIKAEEQMERTQLVALIAGHLVAVKTNIRVRKQIDLTPASGAYEALEGAVRIAETICDIAEQRYKTGGA